MKKMFLVIRIGLLFFLAAFGSTFASTAKDGTQSVENQSWTKYGGNPLNLGDNVLNPFVILDGPTYKMWYCAGGDIYYATSSDGISWSTYGKVLQKGDYDSWEATLGGPSVIVDGAMFKMWYHGYSPVRQFAEIGYATSPDGISWTKYEGNPVLTRGGNGGWDDWNIHDPSVLKDGSTYKMWYSGQSYLYGTEKIGYATSSDGISWVKYSGNPILIPGGNGGWDDKHVTESFIMKEGASYKMFYAGQSYSDIAQIGLATSVDGTFWTKYEQNPVLGVGSPSTWDDHSLTPGSVVFDGDAYKMWYQGMGIENWIWRIGLAFAAPPVITANVDVVPDHLNLESHGQWITAYIQLREGYDPEDIDATTILLNGTISPILDPKYGFVINSSEYLVDHNNDGILDRMVKFDRAMVEEFIYNQGITYGEVSLTITGELFDGTPFEGTDVIFVNYAGDVNSDGIVNILDAAAVSAHWYPGPPIGPLGYDANGDFNKDGAIDILDAGMLSANWGQTTPTL